MSFPRILCRSRAIESIGMVRDCPKSRRQMAISTCTTAGTTQQQPGRLKSSGGSAGVFDRGGPPGDPGVVRREKPKERRMKIKGRDVTRIDIFIVGVVGFAILSMIIIGIVFGITWSLVSFVFWIIVGLILGMRGMLRRRG